MGSKTQQDTKLKLTADIMSNAVGGALTHDELKRMAGRARPTLVRMIMHGTLTREKQKAKEMRKRSLSGKYGGLFDGGATGNGGKK